MSFHRPMSLHSTAAFLIYVRMFWKLRSEKIHKSGGGRQINTAAPCLTNLNNCSSPLWPALFISGALHVFQPHCDGKYTTVYRVRQITRAASYKHSPVSKIKKIVFRVIIPILTVTIRGSLWDFSKFLNILIFTVRLLENFQSYRLPI